MFRLIGYVATLVVLYVTAASADASLELMKQLVDEYTTNTKEQLPDNGDCTVDRLAVRKEWYVRLPSPFALVSFRPLRDHQTVNMTGIS